MRVDGQRRLEGRRAGRRGRADRAAAPDHPYVGRGGVKLAHALDTFAIDPRGRRALDVGASTGGFTDVLLQRGAESVIALDVGRGQLDWRLRTDPRVIVREGVNARALTAGDVPHRVSLVTIDVAFISLKHILPALPPFLEPHADVVALVKPQFEAGRDEVGKHGIVVRSRRARGGDRAGRPKRRRAAGSCACRWRRPRSPARPATRSSFCICGSAPRTRAIEASAAAGAVAQPSRAARRVQRSVTEQSGTMSSMTRVGIVAKSHLREATPHLVEIERLARRARPRGDLRDGDRRADAAEPRRAASSTRPRWSGTSICWWSSAATGRCCRWPMRRRRRRRRADSRRQLRQPRLPHRSDAAGARRVARGGGERPHARRAADDAARNDARARLGAAGPARA